MKFFLTPNTKWPNGLNYLNEFPKVIVIRMVCTGGTFRRYEKFTDTSCIGKGKPTCIVDTCASAEQEYWAPSNIL